MKESKISAIIVAAGYSSRMGCFKPFLKFDNTTALEMIVNTYKNSRIDDIIVVIGNNGSKVSESLKNTDVRIIDNNHYQQGMFSSILKGVEALNGDAFFLHPVDIPLVKKDTLKVLKDKYIESHKGIVYPVFCGRQGHPPLIDCRYKHAILNSDGEGGLKKVLKKFQDDAVSVAVLDETVLMDMDTKEDYEKLLKYFLSGVPSKNECYEILHHYSVPDHIVKHSIKVAEVAMKIVISLKKTDCILNEKVLEAACLLHDIARFENNHAQVGEQIMKDMGYSQIGEIIATHMDIKVDDDLKITENEILFLADKLVQEDTIVSLDERFITSLKEFQDNPEILNNIENKWENAKKIILKIQKMIGKDFAYE